MAPGVGRGMLKMLKMRKMLKMPKMLKMLKINGGGIKEGRGNN